jgi:hypothetical protein
VTGVTTQADTLSKEQAAEALGVSVRTLLREVGAGRIAHLPKRRPADPTLFSSEEVERYRRASSETPYVSATVTPGTPDTPAGGALVRRADGEQVTAFFAQLLAAAQNGHTSEPSISDLAHKLFLTEREAAAYSGLPLATIRGARAQLKTAKRGGRSFLVRRDALEAWARKL